VSYDHGAEFLKLLAVVRMRMEGESDNRVDLRGELLVAEEQFSDQEASLAVNC